MTNKNYKRGYAFERKCRIHLEEQNLFVMRSGGSKGVADLLAIKYDEEYFQYVYFIQCKNHGSISHKETAKLYDVACDFGGIPILAQQDPNKRGKILFQEVLGFSGVGAILRDMDDLW